MERHRRLAGMVMGLLGLLALSCNTLLPSRPSLTSEPTSLPLPSATPKKVESTPIRTPTPETPSLTITLNNASPYPICEVYIAPVEEESWGKNLLARRIEPGATQLFELPEGVVDVEVWTCDGAVLSTFWNLDTDVTLTVGSSEEMETLRVVNTSGLDICEVYVADVESPEWGENWLPGHEMIEVEGQRLFFLPTGLYDAIVQDCDGNIIAQVTLPVRSGGLTWDIGAQYGPGDRYIYIYNRSDYTICGLYFGPPESEFSPNLVGSDALIEFSPAVWAVEVGLDHPWVVLVEDCDGLRLDYNPEVYPGSWVVIGGEGLVPLEVYNYTDAPICEVYISLSTNDSWGDNWLIEGEVLNPQGGTRVFFVEPNTYDFLAVGCDGGKVAEYREGVVGEQGAYWKLNP